VYRGGKKKKERGENKLKTKYHPKSMPGCEREKGGIQHRNSRGERLCTLLILAVEKGEKEGG